MAIKRFGRAKTNNSFLYGNFEITETILELFQKVWMKTWVQLLVFDLMLWFVREELLKAVLTSCYEGSSRRICSELLSLSGSHKKNNILMHRSLYIIAFIERDESVESVDDKLDILCPSY